MNFSGISVLSTPFVGVTIIASLKNQQRWGTAYRREKKSRRRRGVSNEKSLKIQEGYLNFLRRERIPVAVHFFTGMQLRGLVRGFDTYTFVLELEGTNKQILIFKHGVLYIDPMRPAGDIVGRLAAESQQSEQPRQGQQRQQQQKQRRPQPAKTEPNKAD